MSYSWKEMSRILLLMRLIFHRLSKLPSVPYRDLAIDVRRSIATPSVLIGYHLLSPCRRVSLEFRIAHPAADVFAPVTEVIEKAGV